MRGLSPPLCRCRADKGGPCHVIFMVMRSQHARAQCRLPPLSRHHQVHRLHPVTSAAPGVSPAAARAPGLLRGQEHTSHCSSLCLTRHRNLGDMPDYFVPWKAKPTGGAAVTNRASGRRARATPFAPAAPVVPSRPNGRSPARPQRAVPIGPGTAMAAARPPVTWPPGSALPVMPA